MKNALAATAGIVVFIAAVYLYRAHTDREWTSARMMRDMAAAQTAQARRVPPRTRPQDGMLADGSAEAATPTGELTDIPAAWASGPERKKLELLGRRVYAVHCAACHGIDGRGGTPAAKAEGMPAIASFTDDKYAHTGLEQMYRSIARGQGNMPAYDRVLSTREIWAAALRVRRLRDGQGDKLPQDKTT